MHPATRLQTLFQDEVLTPGTLTRISTNFGVLVACMRISHDKITFHHGNLDEYTAMNYVTLPIAVCHLYA